MKLSLAITFVALILVACSGGGGGCYSGLEVDCASAGDVGADEMMGPEEFGDPHQYENGEVPGDERWPDE